MWIYAAVPLLCWLVAPWTYRRLAQAIDRVWLHRSYSHVEAERRS